MSQKLISVNPKSIEIPEDAYPRRKRPQEKDVEHLRGVEWHHKVVTANGGKTLVDGAHRITAAILDGIKKIDVMDLGKLDTDQILREAVIRNATHGKQLTLIEKQSLATKLFGDNSPAELQTMLGVSDRTISRWIADVKESRKEKLTKYARKELAKAEKMKASKKKTKKGDPRPPSVTSLAKEIGVPRGTLQSWLAEPEEEAAAKKAEKKAKKNKAKKDKAASKAQPFPPAEAPVPMSELLEETQELVGVSTMAFVGECKACVKESDNPDGLHWSDFAKVVFVEVAKQFPKTAS